MHAEPSTTRNHLGSTAVVSVETLELVGLAAAELFVERQDVLLGVAALREGFAVLDLPRGPREVALDFLPACRVGDVLCLRRSGDAVHITVDPRATRRARLKLERLLSVLAPRARH